MHIPAYAAYTPQPLLDAARASHAAVPGIDGLTVQADLLEQYAHLQTPEALQLVVDVYTDVRDHLARILDQRVTDRATLDQWTRDAREANAGVDYRDPAYVTVVGRADHNGRVLVGPDPEPVPVTPVTLPDAIAGTAVTLFGPPDSAKMCINAMNALHRIRPDEPAIVAELVDAAGTVPRWGADSEDSKTPFVGDLLAATANLAGCYARDLELTDDRGRHYALADDRLSVPIKRIPGIALPAATHQLEGSPLPLHLLDFVLHQWLNRDRPDARVFYVPKLENEEEAAYLHALVQATERRIQQRHPAFVMDATRLFVVFETPRAIFRIDAMAEALHPYFAGGSLGWHDFLAATARLFRHDANYRIPVKADPNIVIHHIKESHVRLAETLAPRGAIRIGGMYGTLFEDGNPTSFQVSMVGYVRDIITQLRRGLDGFWVAHPDFVRVGIALVEAWRRRTADPADPSLDELVAGLVPDPTALAELRAFLAGDDVAGLASDDPLYPRALLAADVVTSDVIANHDPEEVRYNVFQALQYLAAWLGGTGCVALPATLPGPDGEPVFVRVMDDLATTERSRWEVWAEVAHGRVSEALFDRILDEEVAFLQAGRETGTKRVQVPWDGPFARWYPVAVEVLRALVTTDDPPEAVTEWILPFTLPCVREAPDPLARVRELCPGRF
jgi:malate synthase